MNSKMSLYDLTLAELMEWISSQQEPAYRAGQIFHELYKQGITQPQQITTLPKGLREKLNQTFPGNGLETVRTQQSSDGTVKYLFKLADGQSLETVLIPAEKRFTVCVSTQVGCAYACAFCASGMAGFRRNLNPGEIVQQVLAVQRTLGGKRVTNVVFMGMGEPLANYENLLKAIRIINTPEGLQIGARKITISTVGLVPMIERLTKEGLQIELAISLHAPNDSLRAKLMPVNKKYPLESLIAACRQYVDATKRIITFEYILIDQVNDGLEQAKELAQLLQGLPAKMNLIPCHPILGAPWKRPMLARMLAFEKFLRSKGIACTLRRSRGLDIDGACGQLRLRHEEATADKPSEQL